MQNLQNLPDALNQKFYGLDYSGFYQKKNLVPDKVLDDFYSNLLMQNAAEKEFILQNLIGKKAPFDTNLGEILSNTPDLITMAM